MKKAQNMDDAELGRAIRRIYKRALDLTDIGLAVRELIEGDPLNSEPTPSGTLEEVRTDIARTALVVQAYGSWLKVGYYNVEGSEAEKQISRLDVLMGRERELMGKVSR